MKTRQTLTYRSKIQYLKSVPTHTNFSSAQTDNILFVLVKAKRYSCCRDNPVNQRKSYVRKTFKIDTVTLSA